MRIAVDQDQVLANLMSKWISTYNEEWDDSLLETDITDWDITQFVKPECGEKIYDIIKRPGFYLNLAVIEGALEGVQALLNMGVEIAVVSASPMTAYQEKHMWLEKHFPMLDRIIFATDKSWINADAMIDDGTHNLESFKGFKMLFDAPWNRADKRFFRVDNWKEITNVVHVLKTSNFRCRT